MSEKRSFIHCVSDAGLTLACDNQPGIGHRARSGNGDVILRCEKCTKIFGVKK